MKFSNKICKIDKELVRIGEIELENMKHFCKIKSVFVKMFRILISVPTISPSLHTLKG